MIDHNNCQELLASLSDYVDGILRQDLCAQIEAHMSTCENCRIVVDTLRKTINLYQITADPPILPEDVRKRLYQRLSLDDFLK